MKTTESGSTRWRTLLLGVLLGVAVTAVAAFPQGLSLSNWRNEWEKGLSLRVDIPGQRKWPPPEFLEDSGWCFLRYDEDNGWSTGPAGSFENLLARYDKGRSAIDEIVIPVFPSVFTPMMYDKLYYDAIDESTIKEGDKVLVIGTGSGADAWAAWRKSRSSIYTVDINPMAVVNAHTTARIAGFELNAVVGDVTTTELPESFSGFDVVLWNMPFAEGGKIRNQNFHDGDDGTILERFLPLLPSLLKPDGTAILLNVDAAQTRILAAFPNAQSTTDGNVRLFKIQL